MTIFLTVVVTVAVTLIGLNFVTGEKKIDQKLQSLYSVSDPQFLRSMGSLLGPALRDGNRITGLSNGDEMFNRTHRKLLVVDGALGFTGGVGIADPWLGHAQDAEHWRDSHYRLEGPAVAQLQAAFMDNWMKASGEVLHGEEYFPTLTTAGKVLAQVFKSSPGKGSESVRLMYLLSIASARKHLRIDPDADLFAFSG